MRGGKTKFFNKLGDCPWWVSVIITCTAYIALSFVLQNIQTGNKIMALVKNSATFMAPFLVLLLLIPALFAYFKLRRKRRELDIQASIETLNALSLKTFEELVAEAFRRQGYLVFDSGFGPDDGIDIRLVKRGNITLVQCKQWRSKSVGVSVVREILTILTAEKAAKVIVISCDGFTRDAQEFAENKPIELMGGAKLLEMLGEVQNHPKIEQVDVDVERAS